MKTMVKSLGIAAFAVMLAFALTTCDEPEPPLSVINIAAIQGVTVPVKGGIPVTVITENTQYSGIVKWNDNPSVFAASTAYTATITLTAKAGFTLQGVTANFFTVAGATSVRNNANSGVITAVFPATDATSTASVNINITAPVKGATPSTTATASGNAEGGNNFTIGAVSWSPSDKPFLGNTVYTASVTLMADSGYTFTGLSSATVNGQSAEMSNNTGSTVMLSHIFPATNIKTVSGIAIKTQPSNLTYTHGDTLDLTGLVVTLTYDDATTEDVAAANFTEKNIIAFPAHGNSLIYSILNGQPVTITYGSLTCNTNLLTMNRAVPTAADFNVSGTGTFTFDGNSRTVTITRKAENSNVGITIKYNGITTAPSMAGEYTVTFDVVAATNYDSVTGLSAGTLTIEKATPTAADFNISGTGTFTFDGNSKTVTIMRKTGKSDGDITVKYNGITTAPSMVGEYTITFDVAVATNFNAANGFSAGTLTIEKATPTAADFNVNGTGTFTFNGDPMTVTITPKTGKSDGGITIYYEGTGGTSYAKSANAPFMPGTYAVTIDITAVANFNAVNGLSAGTLKINPFTSASAATAYLNSKPNNTPSTPYIIPLSVSSLDSVELSYKYYYLDLSGSITKIKLLWYNTQ